MSNKQWEIGSIIGLDDVIRWDGKVSPEELEQVINQLQAGEITVAEAQKWAESITLTLAGDARGSVNIDGSGNVSLTVTVNKATQAEAETGENNTRFMTPLRTKQLVDASGLVKGSDLTSHVEDKSNPHGVTKTQVGLSNVDNVKQATKAEFDSHVADKSNPHSTTASQVGAYSKTESDNRFETPVGSQQKVNAHADLTNNPHGVTKAQVGLGSVPNNSMASQAEAEAGTSNARFMSPQRTKQAIDVHANSTNNPHSVTKTQIGLGSVPNYGLSSKAEAESGTANNRFMSPLRVKEAFDKFIETVSTALNNFIARRDNPHQVTKSQVGLGNVDNVQQAPATRTISTGTGLTGGGNLTANRTLSVDIATTAEAQAGTNNTKVMTPLRTKQLVEKRLGGVKFCDLSEPMIFAHRGAKNIFPESSLGAYRACVDMGLPIEVDIRMTADNTLVVSHDEKVDRTTNRSGYVSDYSMAGLKNLDIIELGTSLIGTPATLEELFNEFGNKAIYIIEPKERETAQPIINMILAHSLEENCLIQSFDRGDLDLALEESIPTMYLTGTAEPDPATIKSDGIDFVCVSSGARESYINDCLSEGLKVGVYTINRRHEYDKFLSLGVTAFFTDDPLWITGKSKKLDRDNFDQQTFYHGQISPPKGSGGGYGSNQTTGSRGVFSGVGKFGWIKSDEERRRDFSLQGFAGELQASFEITVGIFLEEKIADRDWASVVFCTPIDYFDDDGEMSSGYNLLMRQNGMMQLYKKTDGVSQLLEEVSTPALTTSKVELKISITNNNISVERTDNKANNEIITVNDGTYRNGYLHLGRKGIGVSFGSIKIS